MYRVDFDMNCWCFQQEVYLTSEHEQPLLENTAEPPSIDSAGMHSFPII